MEQYCMLELVLALLFLTEITCGLVLQGLISSIILSSAN